jgi:hypothetical protein
VTWEAEIGKIATPGQPRHRVRPSLNKKKKKKKGLDEWLKHEALSSNPSTTKTRKCFHIFILLIQ